MRTFSKTLVTIAALAAFACVALPAGEAQAHEYYYYHGPHPIPEAWGGGWCDAEGPHYHEFAPVDIEFYEYIEGYYVFVGDPWFSGYDGPLYWYYGPHPVYTPWGTVVCYIDGPHLWYAPPPVTTVGWYYTDGYYYYRGAWPAHYRSHYRMHLSHYYPRRYDYYRRHAPPGQPPHRPGRSDRVSAHPERHGGDGRAPRTRATPPPRSGRDRADSPRYGGRSGDSPRYGGRSGDTPRYGGRSGDLPRSPGRTPRATPAPDRRRDVPRAPDGYSGRKPSSRKPAASRRTDTGRKPTARPAPSYRSTKPGAAPGRSGRLKTRPGRSGGTPAGTPSKRYRTPTRRKATTPSYRRTKYHGPARPAITGGTSTRKKKKSYSTRKPSRGSKPKLRRGGFGSRPSIKGGKTRRSRR